MLLKFFTPDPAKVRERMRRETELALIDAEAARDAANARVAQLAATMHRLTTQCESDDGILVEIDSKFAIPPVDVDFINRRMCKGE